jgi:acetyltransferase
VLLTEDQAFAVDARIIVKPSHLSAPHHLVISPYPNQYEMTTTTKGGLKIIIRPIKPEDAPLLVELFNAMSQQSIYYRFFSPLKSLSHKMLVSLTQIDYDYDMALVALDKTQTKERILGVARIMSKPGGIEPEFAVAVGDPWQGKGVGATLMNYLLTIAKERGMETIWGIVLTENSQMIALARKIGGKISRGQDGTEYEVKIDMKNLSINI